MPSPLWGAGGSAPPKGRRPEGAAGGGLLCPPGASAPYGGPGASAPPSRRGGPGGCVLGGVCTFSVGKYSLAFLARGRPPSPRWALALARTHTHARTCLHPPHTPTHAHAHAHAHTHAHAHDLACLRHTPDSHPRVRAIPTTLWTRPSKPKHYPRARCCHRHRFIRNARFPILRDAGLGDEGYCSAELLH